MNTKDLLIENFQTKYYVIDAGDCQSGKIDVFPRAIGVKDSNGNYIVFYEEELEIAEKRGHFYYIKDADDEWRIVSFWDK
jgi:hypothetical protein